jgi:hypothetical protein
VGVVELRKGSGDGSFLTRKEGARCDLLAVIRRDVVAEARNVSCPPALLGSPKVT